MQGDGVQVVAVVTSATSGAAAFITDDVSLAIFGVPMSVVLAAFAGAMISLTFISAQGFGRALTLISSGTVAGAYLAPLIAKFAGVLVPGAPVVDALDKPVAFLLGLAFQIGVPAFFAWINRKGGVNA